MCEKQSPPAWLTPSGLTPGPHAPQNQCACSFLSPAGLPDCQFSAVLWLFLLGRCVSGEQDRPGWQTSGGIGSGPGVGAGTRPGMFGNIRGKYSPLPPELSLEWDAAGSGFSHDLKCIALLFRPMQSRIWN